MIDDNMIGYVVQRCVPFKNEWLECLLKNPAIQYQILELIPMTNGITDIALKNAANNKNITLKMLRYLINKK